MPFCFRSRKINCSPLTVVERSCSIVKDTQPWNMNIKSLFRRRGNSATISIILGSFYWDSQPLANLGRLNHEVGHVPAELLDPSYQAKEVTTSGQLSLAEYNCQRKLKMSKKGKNEYQWLRCLNNIPYECWSSENVIRWSVHLRDSCQTDWSRSVGS